MYRLIVPVSRRGRNIEHRQCTRLIQGRKSSSSSASSGEKPSEKDEKSVKDPREEFAKYQFQKQLDEIKIREVNHDERLSNYKSFSVPRVRPSPVKQVVAKNKIRRALKKGSFIRSLFAPQGDSGIDTDYLFFPEILKSRHQFKDLVKQAQIVEKYFTSSVLGKGQKFNNEDVLRRLFDQGYTSLWTLTKVEMMNIIESMGAAVARKVIDNPPSISKVAATSLDLQLAEKEISTVQSQPQSSQVQVEPLKVDQFWLPIETLVQPNVQLASYADHALVNQDELSTIIKLLNTQIALSVIDNSPNSEARSLIYDELNQNPHIKIAFAFGEANLTAGDLPCYDFNSTADLTTDKQYWLLNGVKDNILAGDYDYFLVFARNKDYPDSALRPDYLLHQPVPFPGMIAVLVKRSEVAAIREYTRNNINYMEIRVDDLLIHRGSREICESVVDGVQAMNAKGLLQLAYSSLILGQLKSLVTECHKFIVEQKTPLISSQYMASLFYQANTAIYKLESLIYYSTSLHDGLYKKGYPEISLESSITSVSAVTLGLQCTEAIRKIGGIEVWHKLGPIEDIIVLLGNLVEDNNFTRVQVALFGIDYITEKTGSSYELMRKMPVSPHNDIDHPLKPVIRPWAMARRDFLISPNMFIGEWDLPGYLHPSFGREANCLEQAIRLASYAACLVYASHDGELDRIGRKYTFQLYPVYEQVADVFTLITCAARASRAYSETVRNSDVDLFYARYLCIETLRTAIERVVKLEYDVLDNYKACIDINEEWYCKNENDPWYLAEPWNCITKETRKEVLEPFRRVDIDEFVYKRPE